MWIAVTVVAASFQTVRTALQHRLRGVLSVNGAGLVRYAFGAPIALAAMGAMVLVGVDLPSPPARFWTIVAAAGTAQVIATVLLIKAFDAADFAIGTVFSKSEVVQTALLSAALVGESLSALGWVAVLVVFAGIVGLAWRPRPAPRAEWRARAMWFGLGAGGLFGLTAIAIRAASRSLGDDHPVVRAVVTLAVMNTMQTVIQGAVVAVREREQFAITRRHWRSSAIVGLLSVCGSACWALAFTLQESAKVRAVGQVELLFTFAVARWALGERHSRRQFAAAACVFLGVATMALAA
jgi:drug/metabolite transporter (DMT)-like permease